MTAKRKGAPGNLAKGLEDAPGVYRFYDRAGMLLYVGKAQSLKKRVASYFGAAAQRQPRLRTMVPMIDRIEVSITPTEGDALVLEHEQINTLKPRYNVLFRDDKSYPYLRLSAHRFPRMSSYRGKPSDDCFGPFPSAWAVGESIRVFQQVFRLRTCTDTDFATRKRPCLLHQIGRCSAPCVGLVGEREYAKDAETAKEFIQNGGKKVVEGLTERMSEAARRQDYEEAARHRDSIKALAHIRHVSAVSGGAPEADFIGCHVGEEGAAVRLVAIRGGMCVGELDFFPENADDAKQDELLGSFISQHYARHKLPARIVTRSNIDPGTLRRLAGGKAKVSVITRPQGAERERVDLACVNARAALVRKAQAAGANSAALNRIGEYLGLPGLSKVDCFDVSHSMGEEAVASCVVCIGGSMKSSQYRRYRLRKAKAGDDYAGIKEAISRRYRNAAKDPVALPGMILVDGGTGQVSAVMEALAGVDAPVVPVLGIAKGPDRKPGAETLVSGHGELLEIPPADLAFRLLQRMRDEAHRFALAGHRKRRDKKRRVSVLAAVEGIGPAKQKALINGFGGLQGLKRASIADLSRINGVGQELASRIYRALHT